jgi:hypothetical protein
MDMRPGKKPDVTEWTGLSWLKIWAVAGSYECGDELSDSIKCRHFLN